ncbi:uncharacterized protein LOC118174102 isoform X3 [Oxyura jamaicensis]|uniref:uncharacterized protein LOC118174102 isoform X3 n=1 Tax=Oxyura jamaicensis TaxID=8884 RepID=UPI0015A5CA5E|nr:uncharacterized protein LOC118174102 isoform X3 [Oxyura jamaicensis]
MGSDTLYIIGFSWQDRAYPNPAGFMRLLHMSAHGEDFPFPEPAVTFVKFRYSPDQAIMEKCVFPILIISDEKTTEIPGILEESFCQHSLLSVQLFSVLYQSFLKKLSCTESSTLPRKTQPIPQHRFLEEEPGEGCLRRYRGTQKQQGAARKTRGDKAGRLHTVTRGLLQQHAGWEGEVCTLKQGGRTVSSRLFPHGIVPCAAQKCLAVPISKHVAVTLHRSTGVNEI